MFFVEFWIQVYELHVGFMSVNVGKQLGNSVGKFVEYDELNNFGTCMEELYAYSDYLWRPQTDEKV